MSETYPSEELPLLFSKESHTYDKSARIQHSFYQKTNRNMMKDTLSQTVNADRSLRSLIRLLNFSTFLFLMRHILMCQIKKTHQNVQMRRLV